MTYKQPLIVWMIVFLLASSFAGTSVKAEEDKETAAIIYMTNDGDMQNDVYFLDALLSAVVKEVDLYAASEVQPGDLRKYEVILFVGAEEGRVPEIVQEEIAGFSGELLAFGHNAEQLSPFAEWKFIGEEIIRTVGGEPLEQAKLATQVISPAGSIVLAEGLSLDKQLPYISKKGSVTYVATSFFGPIETLVLSRSLFTMLDMKTPGTHPAFIGLEGISPISDAVLVLETGMYLADREIPFFMVVSPFYADTDISSNKELVHVLQELQKNGGTVVVETSFTGGLPPLKEQTFYSSDAEYESDRNERQDTETAGIHAELSRSIEALTDLGLYPIAAKEPKVQMSSTEYQALSSSFTSLFGESVHTPAFISKPNLLAGMAHYPNTLGHVDSALPDPLQEVRTSLSRLRTIPGSVISGMYDPSEGAENLTKLVQLMESVPNMEWLQYKQTEQTVQTERVTIFQTADDLVVQSTMTKTRLLYERVIGNPFNTFLWIIAGVVIGFLIAFLLYVVSLRFKLKKRLFKEREHIG
ncbi:DUF2334 domain-containing protein [Sporosarcina cascadiensis]|uniref:DUF2334 domain-containing protein n=1 Tax=Sporosarcina cascadiensis TaxID=2660747 RepID=UPI00129AF0C2|nr:DUF2334 domain-containing protein [Sporosarcina cascadiensis]